MNSHPSRSVIGKMNMKVLHSAIVWSAILLLAGCNSESSVKTDSNRKIRIDMTKKQVVQKLGQPTAKQYYVKSEKPVWGVIEGWVADLQDGDKIEIWDYTENKGTVSVYFLNDSDKVWHTSFVKKGVVF